MERALIEGKTQGTFNNGQAQGKQEQALALIYRLLKSKKYNRILFVVDRASLGEQADDTFKNVKIVGEFPLSKIYSIMGLEEKFPKLIQGCIL